MKDLLCIINGHRTASPCMTCHISCSKMQFPSKGLCLMKKKTIKLMEIFKCLNDDSSALTWRIPKKA